MPGPTNQTRSFRSRATHAGEDLATPIRPLSEPISQTTVYGFADPELAWERLTSDPPQANYARDRMPNARSLEQAVADLEGAEAGHATASGMAAISLILLTFLSAGNRILISADAYADVGALLGEELVRFGITPDFVDTTDLDAVESAITPDTKLIYVETISNPGMKLVDLPAIARIANAHNVLFCVDNTFATPALCRPIEHGADLVVHSATKFLGGHHDLSAGVIVGRTELIARLHRSGYLFGPSVAPMDAWLAVRGIKTLAPRMSWSSQTALEVATWLETHPAVCAVRYAGLPSHPQADIATRLLPDGAGGMIACDLATGSESAAADAMRALQTIPYAGSLGGTSTTIAFPPRNAEMAFQGDGLSRNRQAATLRLSVGLEDPRDLIADLDQALDSLLVAPATTPQNGKAVIHRT